MEQLTLDISGMSCSHCVARVTTALANLGVKTENVSIGAATVAYDPSAISPAAIVQAVESVGYAAQIAGQAA
jgi:copper chaperone CopZ